MIVAAALRVSQHAGYLQSWGVFRVSWWKQLLRASTVNRVPQHSGSHGTDRGRCVFLSAVPPHMLHFQDSCLFKPFPKGTVFYSLSLLLPDLGLSGFLWLFPFSIPLSFLGVCLIEDFCSPPEFCLSYCWKVCSLSVESIPFHPILLCFPYSPSTFSPVLSSPCGWSLLFSFLFLTLAFISVGFYFTHPSSVHPSSVSYQLPPSPPVFPVVWWGPLGPCVILCRN